MAKPKDKWQPENVSLSSNPFASLSGLKKSDIPANETDVSELDSGSKKLPRSNKIQLPKVKSSRLERAHHGGKTVTIVNFYGTPSDECKSAWIKAMKKELGVGGMIEEGVVMLQGDQRERLKTCMIVSD